MTRFVHYGSAFAISVCATGLIAQPVENSIGEVSRTDSPPTIDGKLDDGVWNDAPVLTDFVQVNPDEGQPATERTEVRVLFDDDNLYLGIRCFDSMPDRIVATEMRRDGPRDVDDHLIIVIDPFGSQRDGYLFSVGPAGLKMDALIEGGNWREAWDGIWQSDVSIDEQGWAAEIAIPYKSLSFDPDRTGWSLNVQRMLRRLNETSRWSGARREIGIADLGGAGVIEGFEGDLNQGHGLTFKPFGVLTSEIDDGWPEFDAGFDLFYKITPEITAAITVNTDFAEAEVDQRRVNLSRFPLFFEEKRDFFLEEAGVFEFGNVRQSPRPYFSRRIGLVSGEEQPILAGARITGRSGNVRFGILDVQMEDDDELGNKNLAVGRAIVNVLDESTVGVIATNGNPSARGDNSLVGADFSYVNTSFMGDANFRAGGWVQATRDDPSSGEETYGYAVGGRANVQTDTWNVFSFIAQVDDRYKPGLGFVSRPGEREHILNVTRTYRPESDFIRTVDVFSGGDFYTNLGSTVNTLEMSIIGGVVETNSRDYVGVDLIIERDKLRDPFEISDGVTIPVDTYHWFYGEIEAGTDPSQPIALDAAIRLGEFYDGTRYDYSGEVTFTPNSRFSGSAEYIFQDVNLPGGDFDVEILRTRGTVQFSPELTLDTIVQWDSVSDRAGLNSRLRWEPRPGQEIFLVYNESYDADDDFSSLEREAILKVGATIRF
ncbi:MAG: hypothetical protein Phyf2KO_23330 [Phycisphaerales bacterium]